MDLVLKACAVKQREEVGHGPDEEVNPDSFDSESGSAGVSNEPNHPNQSCMPHASSVIKSS